MIKFIIFFGFVVYMAQAGYGHGRRKGCNKNCTADASWCNSTISTYSQCLNDQYVFTSCRCICEELKKTDCYDQANWCPTYARSSAACSNLFVNNTCCQTCSKYTAVDANNCVDKADWCGSYIASCSTDNNVASQCCFTCSKTKTNNVDVNNCVDKANWCSSFIASCSTDNNVASQCCFTCSKTKTNNGSSCIDASWCPSYVTSSSMCYNVDSSCCKTCQARYSGNSACKYGDKYSWCSPAYCTTNKSDCCYSCP